MSDAEQADQHEAPGPAALRVAGGIGPRPAHLLLPLAAALAAWLVTAIAGAVAVLAILARLGAT